MKSPEQKAADAAAEAANDPMAACMASMNGGNPTLNQPEKVEYEDNLMGQAQQAFDETKAKAAELAGPMLDKAPDVVKDNCKQQ